jgi:hypothetical protein
MVKGTVLRHRYRNGRTAREYGDENRRTESTYSLFLILLKRDNRGIYRNRHNEMAKFDRSTEKRRIVLSVKNYSILCCSPCHLSVADALLFKSFAYCVSIVEVTTKRENPVSVFKINQSNQRK